MGGHRGSPGPIFNDPKHLPVGIGFHGIRTGEVSGGWIEILSQLSVSIASNPMT